jgi:hypothetical protein
LLPEVLANQLDPLRLATPSLDTDAQIDRFAGHDFNPPPVPEFDPAGILPQRGRKCNPLEQLAHRVRNCTSGLLMN